MQREPINSPSNIAMLHQLTYGRPILHLPVHFPRLITPVFNPQTMAALN